MTSPSPAALSHYRASTHPVVRFPLGGIGTGNISLGTRGELRDWEIFNRPGTGFRLPYSFFAISAVPQEGHRSSRILEARYRGAYDRQGGYDPAEMPGLPRFEDAEMTSRYPYVELAFDADTFPVRVSLEAFTPFIPLRAEDSSIPASVLRYRVTNPGTVPVEVSIAGSLTNASGFHGVDSMGEILCQGRQINEPRCTGAQRGLWFGNAELAEESMHYGTMALTTSEPDVTVKPYWFAGQWTDLAEEFWHDFATDGRLEPAVDPTGIQCELGERGEYGYIRRKEVVGSVAATATVAAGEEHVFEFILSWSFPNRLGTWLELDEQLADLLADGDSMPKARNHYALRYPDAWDVVTDLDKRLTDLDADSSAFRDSLYSSSLPTGALEAVADNIATLRSPTCYRIDDGSFFGYEGVTATYGTGAGNVTHVWNYAQTVAALFPELEITMRDKEFRRTREDGFQSFRELRSYQGLPWEMIGCPDGQLGAVLRTLREWRNTGDVAFLERAWPAVRRSLGYVDTHWYDPARQVLAGTTHTTYDIEFVGADPMSNVNYLAALSAAAELAKAAGDDSAPYRERAEEVAAGVTGLLWNGEYLRQDRLGNTTRPFQFGEGCLTDQLLGQWQAFQAGLGHLLPAEMVRTILRSIYEYNFRPDVATVEHVQRGYAMAGEAGTVNCSWPDGGRPDHPFAFCDEVWTGTEYELAAQLIHEGMVAEAMTVVDAVRERYDGTRRNPWSEIEAGWHYTRGMASWSLLTAFSGVRISVPEKMVDFAPAVEGEFSTFWSCGRGWGTYARRADDGWEFTVVAGDLDGFTVNHSATVIDGHAAGRKTNR